MSHHRQTHTWMFTENINKQNKSKSKAARWCSVWWMSRESICNRKQCPITLSAQTAIYLLLKKTICCHYSCCSAIWNRPVELPKRLFHAVLNPIHLDLLQQLPNPVLQALFKQLTRDSLPHPIQNPHVPPCTDVACGITVAVYVLEQQNLKLAAGMSSRQKDLRHLEAEIS